MEDLKTEVLKISKSLGLSHVGSCVSMLPVLEEIYALKNPEDKVLLDNAHAHLAHLMFTNPDDAEKMVKDFGIHCDRRAGCDATGGSLGHAGGIAIGMALANPSKTIYVVFSDGSIQEGSDWEALRLMKILKVPNIRCYFCLNGFSALAGVDSDELSSRILAFCPEAQIRLTENGEGYEGVAGHYTVAK